MKPALIDKIGDWYPALLEEVDAMFSKYETDETLSRIRKAMHVSALIEFHALRNNVPVEQLVQHIANDTGKSRRMLYYYLSAFRVASGGALPKRLDEDALERVSDKISDAVYTKHGSITNAIRELPAGDAPPREFDASLVARGIVARHGAKNARLVHQRLGELLE